MRVFLLLILSLAVLSGCGSRATVSESQCVAGDWQTLGYRDGVNGYRSSQLLNHQDACVKHGAIPDREGYLVGWDQGVREYCEANNGFAVGERGQTYNNVCPDTLRADFLHAYQQGRQLYRVRMEVRRVENLLVQHSNRLEQVKSEIVASAAAQMSGTLTPAERLELLAQTQRLNDERVAIEVEIPELEYELSVKSRELDALNQSLATATF